MEIHTNISLKNFTTMKLGGNARFIADIHSNEEIAKLCRNAKSQDLPIFVLGGGSNVIANDSGFNGIVLRMRMTGFEILSDTINDTTIKIAAGENWDSIVKRTVDMGLSGIESLSAIPGTVGAAPVQNLGAYGQEIADVLETIEAYDTRTDSFVSIKKADCCFAYRSSIFRCDEMGRYIITSITIKLSKNTPQPPFYDSLQKYLDDNNIKIFTSKVIRDAVIEIRKNKLPDPQTIPNTGSFFKNAIIENWQLDDLKKNNPDIPNYEMGDGKYKIPTGWLIENAGLKGALIKGMRVYEKNALVLANESANSYSDLAAARDEIIGKIRDKFHILIEQEPLEI